MNIHQLVRNSIDFTLATSYRTCSQASTPRSEADALLAIFYLLLRSTQYNL
jgi:hypothetical protein